MQGDSITVEEYLKQHPPLQQTSPQQQSEFIEDHYEPKTLPCGFTRCSSYPSRCSECKHNKNYVYSREPHYYTRPLLIC